MVMKKQIWNDLSQAGVPQSETNWMATSEIFRRWQKLAPMQKKPATPCSTTNSLPILHPKAGHLLANTKAAQMKL